MTENLDDPHGDAIRQWLDESEGHGFTFRVERMLSDVGLAHENGELYPAVFSWLRAAFEQGVEYQKQRSEQC